MKKQVDSNRGCKKIAASIKKFLKPLIFVGCNSRVEKAKRLLKHGYKKEAKSLINAKDTDGYTLFDIVCKENDIKLVEQFFPYCTLKNINNSVKGYTPLYWACYNKEKLSKNIFGLISSQDRYRCNRKMFDLIYPKCTVKTINKYTTSNNSPILFACSYNDMYVFEKLMLNCKKDVLDKIAYFDQGSPIYYACMNENIKMVSRLAPYCTKTIDNFMFRNEVGYLHKPIRFAFMYKNAELLEILLAYGADLRKKEVEKIYLKKAKQIAYVMFIYLGKKKKLNYIIRTKVYNYIYKFLIQFIFCKLKRLDNSFSSIEKTEFFKIYKNEKNFPLEKALGVKRDKNKSIATYAKLVAAKNKFHFPKNMLSKMEYQQKLNKVAKHAIYSDIKILCEY